jgi:hypothetical protein
MPIDWIDKEKDVPQKGERVLTYSPCYKTNSDESMLYRLMDAQFVRISTDVTHWARVLPPVAR